MDEQLTDVLPGFNVRIPQTLPGIDSRLLDPRKAWAAPSNMSREGGYGAAGAVQFRDNITKRPDTWEPEDCWYPLVGKIIW